MAGADGGHGGVTEYVKDKNEERQGHHHPASKLFMGCILIECLGYWCNGITHDVWWKTCLSCKHAFYCQAS